ncbi:MAG TPA: hypothetical protein VF373_05385, partial [Prolixibacteraceae bacterium]
HRSPFSPDMNHVHHQLIKITNNHLHATIIMVLGNLILIYLSFGLIDLLGNNLLFFLILTLGFSIAYIPVLINRSKKPETETITVPVDQEIPHLHLIKSIKHQTVAEIENEKNVEEVESDIDQSSSKKTHTI